MSALIGSCWVVTDGKAGDESQCIGVAEALNVPFEVRRVAPRAPFTWAMPRGPIDPRERPGAKDSPIAPPFPDLVIGSGRRAVPYLRHVKKASGGKTFTVCLKDPRTGTSAADLIWVPEHDPLRGANVLTSPTAPHRYSTPRLAQLRQTPHSAIDALASPRVAVLVGGDSRHHTFSEDDCGRFVEGLRQMFDHDHAHFMITLSRRTPALLGTAVRAFAEKNGHFLWDGTGGNPLGHLLAKADALVVTADSTNMIGEAAATGKAIHVFHPAGGHSKIDRFLGTLDQLGIIHPFPGPLKTTTYEPQDPTPMIAAAIKKAMSQRAGRGNETYQD
ncbi:mitochondrial fission ELM1 family protein [Roseibium sp.]|uniref:mitochondrial fission ELM1 family protein n=1 Tax=Roseibium sp. TaxID=1936156 RepID=UPI003A978D30